MTGERVRYSGEPNFLSANRGATFLTARYAFTRNVYEKPCRGGIPAQPVSSARPNSSGDSDRSLSATLPPKEWAISFVFPTPRAAKTLRACAAYSPTDHGEESGALFPIPGKSNAVTRKKREKQAI